MLRQTRKNIDLLMQLRKDGRQSLTDISKNINMPVSTIFDRMRINNEEIVKRFTCILDFRKVGFNCRAQIVFRVKKEDREELQNYILRHPNVNSAYKINNGYDFLVETVFRELKEVDEFLETVDEKFKVLEKKVYYIIDDLAREVFMTDPVHIKMIGLAEQGSVKT